MLEWVILELGPMAEGEDPTLISASIRHLVGKDADVFIPASITQVGEDRVVTYLVDGYAFIRRIKPDHVYFRLDESRYVRAVVRDITGRTRSPACVTEQDIEKFRRQIRIHSDQGIDVGDTVTVTSGPYKGLQAVVVEDISEQDSVQVRIELRSKDSLVTLPRSFLRLVTKAALPPYVVRTRDHREWFTRAKPVLQSSIYGLKPVIQMFGRYNQLGQWIVQEQISQAELRFAAAQDQLGLMRKKLVQFMGLNRWLKAGTNLHSFIRSFDKFLDISPLIAGQKKFEDLSVLTPKLTELTSHLSQIDQNLSWQEIETASTKYNWLNTALIKLMDISQFADSTERHLKGGSMVENIVIDGMNMVVRCAMAPGLSELRDSQGRPTGSVVGFLNSLSSLRKKYPEAEIWVCWDNSSTRRKSRYPEYKANRNPFRNTFEVSWLKSVLPMLGVWQASVEGEEADDVVASLVRGRLEGQQNLIVSNDRDFMQLITDTTQVLVPAVGVGKERLCTPDTVTEEYGVPPSKMVHLRALGGDSSDNIPGAPGCGNKTASKLIQLYGSVEGIFVSNLAGLSQSLRTKLRGAESQVRLNLELMALVSDLELSLLPPDVNPMAAQTQMADIQMNPSRIMTVFFSQTVEAAA